MKDVLKFSAKEILNINRPEKLFTDKSSAKKEYYELSKVWHPDKNPSVDPKVFAQISLLYTIAEKKIGEDAWEVIGSTIIETLDRKKYKIRYHSHKTFELGEIYICDTVMVYLIDKTNKDLVDRCKYIINGFRFADDKMKAEINRFLPHISTISETENHFFIAFNKTKDVISLRDIFDHLGGKIPAVHVAWILSRLYNLSCYMKFTGVSNNAINMDTFLISPSLHSGILIGGWWYASKIGEKLIAVPSHTLNNIPKKLISDKVGSSKIDSELIKSLGREMLGDITGAKLLNDPEIPKPLFNWLQSPGSDDPFSDYRTWMEKILINSFGKRKFVEWNLKVDDIYNNIK